MSSVLQTSSCARDVEEADLELVRSDDAEHPGARHVGFGDRELHVEEHLRIHLVAAPALRLQDPKEPSVLEVLHRVGGQGGGGARPPAAVPAAPPSSRGRGRRVLRESEGLSVIGRAACAM